MAASATRTAPLWVIETEDQQYLGFVRLKDGAVHIMTGRAGRPKVVPLDDLVSLRLATHHEDVETGATR